MQSKREALDDVLMALDRGLQRATYAAVGGLVGLPAQSVMLGRPKAATHSWVVAKATGRPTGYAVHECHPRLTSNTHVIHTSDGLRAWLNAQS